MSRLPNIDPATYTPAQQKVHDAVVSGPRGKIVGPIKVWLKNPGLAEHAQALGAYCRFGTSLPPRLSELAICCTGAFWKASYEWYAHAPLATKAGIDRADPGDQRREIETGGVIGKADGEPPFRRFAAREGAIMRRQEFACADEERRAVAGQPHRARRALDEAQPQPCFQPLELEADRRLRGAFGLRGAGEARQLGDQREGAYGVDVEGGRMMLHRYH